MVSAAHVLDRGDVALYVGTASTWRELPRPYQFTQLPPGGSRDEDRIDIGFVHLPGPFADTLDGCVFLTADEIDEKDSPDFEFGRRSLYLALGWPQNRMRFDWQKHTTKPENLGYVGVPVPRDRYRQVGFNPDTNLLIEFDPKETISSSGVGKPPKLQGISGGGVLRIASPASMDIGGDRLVALTIQLERPDKLIVATRIGLVLRAIMLYHFGGEPAV